MSKTTTWVRRNILATRIVKGRVHQDTICALGRQPAAYERVRVYHVERERFDSTVEAI
jgi:hypothetical protein